MSGHSKKSSKPTTKSGAPLAAYESLSAAVESFVQSNTNFESSTMLKPVVDDLKACTDLNQLFILPLRQRIFSFSSALVWVVFLKNMPCAVEDEAPPFSAAVEFSADKALETIASVYDLGMQEAVWDHFEDSDDEDSDDEDEE
ncbi:MAG: hypothetical protein WC700_07710 [Gemmatimonadaceae bacterium]|jgi:hypothetical protein